MSKGRAARVKGHSFEREVAIALRSLDPTARRNVEETQVASVDIKTRLPLAIQCKCLAKWSVTPHDVLRQAEEGGRISCIQQDLPPEGLFAVGVVRITRKSPDLAILNFKDLLTILSKVTW